MHIYDESYWKPVTCYKCGSVNAVDPVNDRDIALRCLDCGHTKKADLPPWTSSSVDSFPLSKPKEMKNEF